MSFYKIVLFFILLPLAGISQVNNDDCLSAQFISDISNFCSPVGTFSNINAQPSTSPDASCWDDEDHEADVWYGFTPSQPGVFIQLFGEAPSTQETIDNSAISIYQGTCGNLDEIICTDISEDRADILERTLTDLVIGRVYYIRISSAASRAGTFQLCLQEFNPVKTPESDCVDAVVLCDKSSFFIENLQGVGNDPNEVENTCMVQEFASAWYTWTARNNGTLTFTITPNNVNDPEEDLDFAIYRLPNGLEDCSNKELIRCMASGETAGNTPAQNAPCFGPTGLMAGETDEQEFAGCNLGDNNFLAPLQMVQGESYALVVNNFSSSGFGFNIVFGGTGEFLGPTPQFDIVANDGFDCDKTIVFTDNSLENTDQITGYSWNFGEGANPLFLDGPGPHDVLYESFGTKRVALTIETLRGCTSTEILEFEVAACCADNSDLAINNQSFDLICAGVPDGSIEGIGLGGLPEYFYDLNGQGYQPSPIYNGLSAGEYTLTIQDRKGCEVSQDITLTEPPPLIVRVSEDDSVDLGFSIPLDSEFEPVDRIITYDWGPPAGLTCTDCPDPVATPPGSITYILTITDQDGCTATDEVNLFTPLIRPVESANIISLSSLNPDNQYLWISANIAVTTVERYRVYDRYGNVMYHLDNIPFSESPTQGWNGTFKGVDVNPGVYVWMAELTFVDNVTITYHGDVTVVK